MPAPHELPYLDVSSEPWRGGFPGLGQIWVDADGAFGAEPEPPPDGGHESLEQRRRALSRGWAEPLSWRRRGWWLMATLASTPQPESGCLLFSTQAPHADRVLGRLAERGWMFLGDRPTPVRLTEEGLLVHPRAGAILASARAAGADAAPARGDTDARLAAWPRTDSTCKVRGLVFLVRDARGVPVEETVTGRDKLTSVAGLWSRGVLDAEADTGLGESGAVAVRRLTSTMRLTSLPMVNLSVRHRPGDDYAEEAARVATWWSGLDGEVR